MLKRALLHVVKIGLAHHTVWAWITLDSQYRSVRLLGGFFQQEEKKGKTRTLEITSASVAFLMYQQGPLMLAKLICQQSRDFTAIPRNQF